MSTITSSQTTSTFELNPTIQCNDLKAFERRLMETILQQKPRERLWRIVLIVSLTTTAISSYFWLQDSTNPSTLKNSPRNDAIILGSFHQVVSVEQKELTFLQSLAKHYFFTTNCLVLIILFVFGIHQRVIQTNIIVNRIREVLYDFALSCDDQGKLIVKQNFSRPISFSSLTSMSSTSMFSSSTAMNLNSFNINSSGNNLQSSVAQLGQTNQIQRRS